MKIINASGIALLAVSIAMLVTNPGKEQYTDYAYAKLNAEIQSGICKQPELPKFFQGITSAVNNACKSAIQSGAVLSRGDIKNIIENTTERQNLLVASVYTTDISGYTVKTIGAFGNFLTFAK